MLKKKPHKIHSLRELYDYILGRNDSHSRHRMERDIQQDPFLEDAVEGYSSLDEEKAKKLVADLNARINPKTSSARRTWITGMAATIALLIVAGIGYMAVRWVNHSYNEVKFSLEQPVPDERAIMQPLPEKEESRNEPEVENSAPQLIQPERLQINATPARGTAMKKQTQQAPIVADEDIEKPVSPIAELFAEEIQTIPSAGVGNQQPGRIEISPRQAPSEISGGNIIKGKVIEAGSREPLPGVTITIAGTRTGTVTDVNGNFELVITGDTSVKLRASFVGMITEEFSAQDFHNNVITMQSDIASLNEVVVTGYGRSSRTLNQQNKNDFQTITRDPQPVGGYRRLNEYLKKNAIIPDNEPLNRTTVILRFKIDYEGNPVNFEIVESRYEEYAKMAEKLIKDGPKWIPAQLNGQFVMEAIELKIDFRK
jgi:hypothetical protein